MYIIAFTHANGRHVSDSVCLSVCPHDKTKTVETKIAKLGKKIVSLS